MTQTILAYLLVALAAGWVAWSMLPLKRLRAVLKRRGLAQAPNQASTTDSGGCACGTGCEKGPARLV